jgi:Ca2+/Na+ antiporter
MSSPLAAALFVAAAAVRLGASAVLVARLERLGARLGLSEALLGLAAALAADAPEVTSAVTALTHGQHDIGTWVVSAPTCSTWPR